MHVAERIAAESPYQRAAAIWVARKTGKDPARIYGVDWYRTDGEETDAGTYFDGEFGLEYYENGSQRRYDWTFDAPSPGSFLEQCVEILTEEREHG